MTPERATFVSEKRLSLQLGVSEELMEHLRHAQNQVSQTKGRAVTLEETLEEMTRFYLKRKDPIEKAKRAVAKNGDQPLQNPTETLKMQFLRTAGIRQEIRRTPIPKSVEHQVRLRDQNRCQYQRVDGGRCGTTRWIDLHHIKAVTLGGENSLENLMILCKAHHREVHRLGV